jgi:hypothetical protein
MAGSGSSWASRTGRSNDRIIDNGVVGSVAAVAVADFNGDGKPDIAALHNLGPGSAVGAVEILLGNGDGTFRAPLLVGTSAVGSTTSLVVGDLNGDGRPDLVTANSSSNTISVMFNDGQWPAPPTGGGGSGSGGSGGGGPATPAALSVTVAMPFTPADEASPWLPLPAVHRRTGLVTTA